MVFRKVQRLTKKFPRLTVIPNGLSDQTGEAELFVPLYNGNVLTGLGSFDYESAKSWLSSDRVLRFDPMKLTVLSSDCLLFVSMTADCSRISSRSTSKGWNIGFLREGWRRSERIGQSSWLRRSDAGATPIRS